MENTLQLNLHLADRDQARRIWAFAKDRTGGIKRRKHRSLAAYKNCIITACSKEARAFGVRAGMRYEEAKQLLPELRILVIGDRSQ